MIRLGLAGLSGMGRNHVAAVAEVDTIQIAAVCDIKHEIVDEQRANFGCPGFDSYERMMRETEMDAVLLCMPNWEHPPAVRVAVEKGLHVLQEKPVGRSFDEGEESVRLMEEAGLLYVIATQRRFSDTFGRVPGLMAKIGDVFLVRGQYLFQRGDPDFGWRGKKALAWRGALLSMGYHTVDLLNWYMGLPELIGSVNAAQARPWVDYETEDSAVTMFRYAGGAIGYLVSTCAATPDEERVFLHGTKGSIEVSWREVILRDPKGEMTDRFTSEGSWHPAIVAELEHFARAVDAGQVETASARENLDNTRFIDAAYKSADEERMIRL